MTTFANNKTRASIFSIFFGGSPTGNWPERNHRTIITLFFTLLLLLGIGIVRDFGISYDEAANRENGYISLGYVIEQVKPQFYHSHFGGLPELHHYRDKDYGVFFELPAVIFENALRTQNESHIMYMRHFLTFLVFFTGVMFFYRICKQRFDSWKMGLLGCAMLIISPRIFGQAFYNSKDIVFMSFFLIAMYTLLRFLKRGNWQSAVWHALACTAAIDTRIMGILLPLLTMGMIGLEIIKASGIKQASIKWGKLLAVYIIIMVIFVIICWPYLWASPLNNFVIAFQNMSKFRWQHSSLFMGNYITTSKYIPWYYIPVWIVITTPVFYTILFITGSVIVTKNIIQTRFKLYNDEKSRSDLIFLLLFFGPLLAVIVLKSVLYDAWRQMYFIYPAFLLLALSGFAAFSDAASKNRALKYGLIVITALSFSFTAAFMIRNHPLEDVYFSCLPDKVAAKNFEMDYWALSYRKGLKYILEHDTSKVILIGYSPFSRVSVHILPYAQQKRLNILNLKDTLTSKASWMITNFRFDSLPPTKYKKEVYSVYVDKMKVMSVFKLK